MKLTRRIMFAAAALALAGAAFADTRHGEPADRLLQLSISDNFTTQEWVADGQNRTERRNRLVLFEGETIELTIRNDTPEQRFITLGRGFSGVPIAPGRSQVIRFRVQLDGHYAIGLQPQGGYPRITVVELTAEVRPANGRPPPVPM